MYEKTYTGVSRLATNYFKLLCVMHDMQGTYNTMPEKEVPGMGQTYSISLSGHRTYHLMQKVFDDQNG
jgi:hypothetical protein